MNSLPLFKNKQQRVYFFFICLFLFVVNILYDYTHYLKFTEEEIFKTDAKILNIYDKNRYKVLKLQTKNFTFFTSTSSNSSLNKQDILSIYLLTQDISFLKYQQGFYSKTFNLYKINSSQNAKQHIETYIDFQHNDHNISSLYSALFLAIPVNKDLREIFAQFGISHLIAISGFHLGVISLVLYFIFNSIYSPIHQKNFPYRNKRFDILILVSCFLFSYLIFTDLVPSLLRAFVMFIFGLFLLRNNIKLISFETLLIIVIIILSLFPKLIFSLSLWFSVSGVFYIFLFLKYFNKLNKYIQLFFFNFWIYFSINPITHYFFSTTSFEQLFSPLITLLFTLFYPLSIFLHIIGFGGLFDIYLQKALVYEMNSYEVFTPFWFLLIYLGFSFLAIFKKWAFYLLNALLLFFNLYLFI